MSRVAAVGRIPVTILTGFLGAGKTTLLNRILHEAHGRRTAVIENEFGETGIDNELLLYSGEEQIVEMNNGCICCTVRGDLVRVLGELARKRQADPVLFDRVIIETTGLADPAPVAQTFFIDDDIATRYRLDAIVTVVDAVHAERQFEQFHEAQEQVAFADRVLISKTDLVARDVQQRLRARIARMNPRAPVAAVHFGVTPLDQILDIGGFSLDSILEVEPDFLSDTSHAHDDGVSSFVFRTESAFDPERLQILLRDTIRDHARNLMRYKGVVRFPDSDERVVFQGVHMLLSSDVGRPWGKDERRESKLVFIGRDLPREHLLSELERCLVG